MTLEYQRAVETYALTYAQLKKMARASLEYSFLPGSSLWSNFDKLQKNATCAKDAAKSAKPSPPCEQLISTSGKAKAEWKLEKAFVEFEGRF
jgi:hypothetical protein